MSAGEDRAAMAELAEDPASRKRFLKMVGGAGAAGAFAIFLAACGDDDEETSGSTSSTSDTTAKADKGDIEVVNYALTLEYLEAAFYQEVIDAGVIKDKTIGELATSIGENENEHVDALTALVKQLGGTPAAKPKTKFGPVIDGGPDKILETAATVENVGAAAYLGQAGNIKSKDVLAAALSIHTVEGRHAAALNTLVGRDITPDGNFAKPMDMKEVLAAVKPFIAS
ncbi:MAG: ferritin-like domain-containing protein [Thermoleophilaceae bacterium]|nr:ferritin-like domain-containing protein [Thermoleophilaceae bacterium]